MKEDLIALIEAVKKEWSGVWHTDELHKILYATDASVYREIPVAIAIPKSAADLKVLVRHAKAHKIPLIPRGAGTSLAGQVVGSGIVVDTSKHLNKILELNLSEKWVKVQPGVIRDELNEYLKAFGFLFGPETSTSNRCTIGGMVGNNSCGSRSLKFGSVRDHLLGCKLINHLGDDVVIGSEENNNPSDFLDLQQKSIADIIDKPELIDAVNENFPLPEIKRRNHGYAIDALLSTRNKNTRQFDWCKLIAGSEGTLGLLTEITLNISPVLPPHQALLSIECENIHNSLLANISALKFDPCASELIDEHILRCTQDQPEQKANRFFIKGNPKAILIVEFAENSEAILKEKINALTSELKAAGLSNLWTSITGEDSEKVWALRKAGLGLLSNVPGDAKPIAVVEDTAVRPSDLPEYISEFNHVMDKMGLFAVHYAHAGSGELHLRPALNLKSQEGVQQFEKIAQEIAILVKKYRGSLSGEHGDGRLRGGFIEQMYGPIIYNAFKEIKKSWDPDHLFNPGKITDVPPITKDLRFTSSYKNFHPKTAFSYTESGGLQQAVEQCNGSADCIKSTLTAGTMCPSYWATKHERDSTRGRANVLREALSGGNLDSLNSEQVKDALSLCISCKACKRECPSNVDMAKLKAEVLHQQLLKNPWKLRPAIVAYAQTILVKARPFAPLVNLGNKVFGPILKPLLGIHANRTLPVISKAKYAKPHYQKATVWLLEDEFTATENPDLFYKAVKILHHMGIKVNRLPISNSGRSLISAGYLSQAKALIKKNLSVLKDLEITAIIGLEPSAVLSLKDEYIGLSNATDQAFAKTIAAKTFCFETYIAQQNQPDLPIAKQPSIKIHAHCYQKALEHPKALQQALENLGFTDVTTLDSGCCGMAGFFGYEKKNYSVSKKIAQTKLMPLLSKSDKGSIILAAGTSCRHQIKDLSEFSAQHPVHFLYQQLRS